MKAELLISACPLTFLDYNSAMLQTKLPSRMGKTLLSLLLLGFGLFWYFKSLDIDKCLEPKIQSEKILINFAPPEDLKTLPGIGEATVEKILSLRKQKPFENFEDFISRPYRASPESRPRKIMPTAAAELIREYLDLKKKPPRNDKSATAF